MHRHFASELSMDFRANQIKSNIKLFPLHIKSMYISHGNALVFFSHPSKRWVWPSFHFRRTIYFIFIYEHNVSEGIAQGNVNKVSISMKTVAKMGESTNFISLHVIKSLYTMVDMAFKCDSNKRTSCSDNVFKYRNAYNSTITLNNPIAWLIANFYEPWKL